MKRLLSLLMISSLVCINRIDAGCASCRSCPGGSTRRMTRRERRAARRANSAQVQSTKTKAAPAPAPAPAPVKKDVKAPPAKAGKIHHISSKAELDALTAKGKPVVVKYSADWCGACKMIAEDFKKLANEFDQVIFAHVDNDTAQELTSSQGVRSLPTIHVHKGGKKVDQIIGANKDLLRTTVVKHA